MLGGERPGAMRSLFLWLAAGLLALLVVGCGPVASPTPSGETGTLEVAVVAGPVCPVETVPPQPGCEPRPVVGARVLVQPGDGRDIVVAQGVTDADGLLRLELTPGEYIVVGAEVDGLFGLPEPMPATVAAARTATVTLSYDTGIR